MAVVDPGSKRPELVVNRKDNSSFWHNTIAIDTQTNKIVVGAEARKIVRIILHTVSFNVTNHYPFPIFFLKFLPIFILLNSISYNSRLVH